MHVLHCIHVHLSVYWFSLLVKFTFSFTCRICYVKFKQKPCVHVYEYLFVCEYEWVCLCVCVYECGVCMNVCV